MFNNTLPPTFPLSGDAQQFKEILTFQSEYYRDNSGVTPNKEDYYFKVTLLVGLSITTLLIKAPLQLISVLPALKEVASRINSFENFNQTEKLFNYAPAVAVIVEKTTQVMGYSGKSLPYYQLFSNTLRGICDNIAITKAGKQKEAKKLLENWLK